MSATPTGISSRWARPPASSSDIQTQSTDERHGGASMSDLAGAFVLAGRRDSVEACWSSRFGGYARPDAVSRADRPVRRSRA